MAHFGRMAVAAVTLALAGCVARPVAVPPPPQPQPVVVALPAAPAGEFDSAREAARAFVSVMRTMEPAVEQQCLTRRRAPINCDFQFVVDDRAGLEPNAFQTVDASGRPVIGFTLSLIAAARNTDELAFVVGHEASHHILGHLGQKARSAQAGAVILGGIAQASGGGAGAIRSAATIGAQLGARSYSKQWELEADYLGTIISRQAGFDPVRGSQFFLRIPDPGDHVLGSHPARAQRLAQVQRAIADMDAGRSF